MSNLQIKIKNNKSMYNYVAYDYYIFFVFV